MNNSLSLSCNSLKKSKNKNSTNGGLIGQGVLNKTQKQTVKSESNLWIL